MQTSWWSHISEGGLSLGVQGATACIIVGVTVSCCPGVGDACQRCSCWVLTSRSGSQGLCGNSGMQNHQTAGKGDSSLCQAKTLSYPRAGTHYPPTGVFAGPLPWPVNKPSSEFLKIVGVSTWHGVTCGQPSL